MKAKVETFKLNGIFPKHMITNKRYYINYLGYLNKYQLNNLLHYFLDILLFPLYKNPYFAIIFIKTIAK